MYKFIENFWEKGGKLVWASEAVKMKELSII